MILIIILTRAHRFVRRSGHVKHTKMTKSAPLPKTDRETPHSLHILVNSSILKRLYMKECGYAATTSGNTVLCHQ